MLTQEIKGTSQVNVYMVWQLLSLFTQTKKSPTTEIFHMAAVNSNVVT